MIPTYAQSFCDFSAEERCTPDSVLMGQRLVLTGQPEQPAPEMSFDRYFVALAASPALRSSYALPPFPGWSAGTAWDNPKQRVAWFLRSP
jgi:hypothetical protein